MSEIWRNIAGKKCAVAHCPAFCKFICMFQNCKYCIKGYTYKLYDMVCSTEFKNLDNKISAMTLDTQSIRPLPLLPLVSQKHFLLHFFLGNGIC
jgi:hypothetical protein